MQELEEAGRFTGGAGPNHFVEHLRIETMSVGTYSIPTNGVDDQDAHDEDEIYFVVSGRGRFDAGDQTVEVGPGVTLFVAAGETHRFHDVTEDLALLVVFAPPYRALRI